MFLFFGSPVRESIALSCINPLTNPSCLIAYASSLRLSPSSASLALALLNGTSVIGRISLGMLSDRFSPWLLASSTLLCTALTVFILWGLLSYTFAGIIVYGIAYGFLASGYQSLWTAFVRPIASESNSIFP